MSSVVPKVFGSMTPPQLGIECYRSLRTDAFAPVVFVCEAPAGPAHVRHFYRFERSDDIIANPARVRNFGVRADPDSFVNTFRGARQIGRRDCAQSSDRAWKRQ